MTLAAAYKVDDKLDLVLERVVDVPRETVWKAWTEPEHLKKWFCPAPWKTVECDLDLRPGGRFNTVMQGPDGERMEHTGSYVELVTNEKLVFTDAFLEDYRPASKPNDCVGSFFTAFLLLEKQGNGTKYTVIAKHGTEAGCQKHKEMGFHDGWSAALDQLVELAHNKQI